MFKLRRRAGAAVAGSDLPYCAMCQQPIRVDAATGRCALGHRAAAPASPVLGGESVAAAVDTDVLQPVDEAAAPYGYDTEAYDPYDTIVYGRSSDSLNDNGDPVTWDPSSAAAAPASSAEALEEYATWGESSDDFSALDVDTEVLPAVPSAAAAGASQTTELFEELDDLDDATHARRQAVGTIGATIGVSGMVLAAIAALPF